MFPNAKFIHCQRHPLDTCLSIFFQNFESIPYSYDLTNIAKYFLRYRAITKDNRHDLGNKNKWLDVVYEDFVSNKTAVIAQISNFLACEIDANDDIDSQNIPIRTMSKWQARQGIHQSSIGRWELYKDKLGGLQESLASIL